MFAAQANSTVAGEFYDRRVNPQWVRLLNALQMNVHYTRCSGTELFTSEGRTILDFLSGYCVHNIGHNHPAILEAIKDELDRLGPAMLQSHVPEHAGALAEALCERAGGTLKKVFFPSSGSEGVEAAIKFVRAHTKRDGLLYAQGAFHGLTCGALSMMGDKFWREGFGPMLAGCDEIPFDDLAALEQKLATKRYAAYFVEPVQAEAGIRIPDPGYLKAAKTLCQRYGSLLVIDEVQTGMYRTGTFLAARHFQVDADIVVMAKALSGGLIPSGAVLMTDEIYSSVYSSLKRSIVHTSTFSENALAMRVGLATLRVLEEGRMGERAIQKGEELRARLRDALSGYEMVKDVRGLGMLGGVEFQAPRKLSLRAAFEAFMAIHPGMFGQIVVMRLFRDHNLLTQMCGNNFMVLKVAPPLIVSDEQIGSFVAGMKSVVENMHGSASFWTEALGLARRVVNV